MWNLVLVPVLGHIKVAVATAELGDVRHTVGARTDDVAIHLEGSRGKATGTGGIAVSLFIALQSFQKVMKKQGFWMQVVVICVGIAFGSCAHPIQRGQRFSASLILLSLKPVISVSSLMMRVG